MIFTAIIAQNITSLVTTTSKPVTKTPNDINQQMERIYKLYAQGYGTKKMLTDCENKIYEIIIKISY